ncbi:(E3-independent) E2 ubiquitin-conjugating enzyme [Ranunculus cassubicifolius]
MTLLVYMQILTAMENFKQFDVVTDASDHHFANSNLEGKQLNKQVTKKIMQEWKILEENLPKSSIFVRVYEDRMDLLRAVIIGPPGTPYYNGLFFFDICFPSDYPAKPPTLNYRSFGIRMNPNLYKSGKVCLSLLNTWSGEKNEKWNPSQSTVLQVLLSIQALVLNEWPYYNEPGVPELNKEASAYNENTWVNTCQTMNFLLHNPPKHFKELVIEHFRGNAYTILNACMAYMAGYAKIGAPVIEGRCALPVYKVSENFRSCMIVVWPKLLDWFGYIGVDVQRFRKEQMFLPNSVNSKADRKSKDGTSKKNWSKLLKFFGCLQVAETKNDKAIIV